MDTATERKIQSAIDNLKSGRTIIAIAHRLSTLRDADKLYVIEHGEVKESGTHDELIRTNGKYFELYKLQSETTAIYDVDTLNILSPDKIGLTETESGYLEFSYDGRDYEKVDLTRLVPFNDENRYISVSYKNEEDEWKEIGVIKDLDDLSADTKKTADDYLKLKYYIPEIKKIHRITDNQMGYLFLEADTTAGEKKIAVYDWWHNFRVIHGKMLAVTDADGNRYSVPDVDRLDKASIKKLQLFI